MEIGRKKRKMGNEEGENDDDDDDEEEEKVEKFFALIRSTREMRDRLRNVSNGSKEEEEKKKQEKKSVATMWNPTFQPEDFMEVSKSKNPLAVNVAGPSSKRELQEEEKETKEGAGEDSSLDLKLSL